MEDDDEFGDLYTDVLRQFTSSLSSVPYPQHPSTAPSSTHPPIALNLKTDDEEDEIICGTTSSYSDARSQPNDHKVCYQPAGSIRDSKTAASCDSMRVLIDRAEQSLAQRGKDSADGVREGGFVKLPKRVLGDVNRGSEFPDVDGIRSNDVVEEVNLEDKDVKFDIEEDNYGTDDMGSEPIIPGLSSAGGDDEDDDNCDRELVPGLGMNSIASGRYVLNDGGRGEGDDWDSDSEDDLQIVLNDDNHGHTAVERGPALGEDGVGEDEDADRLVIVANGDSNQAAEEQRWGEDGAQEEDGERKETNEAGKAGSVSSVAPKSVYSGYHPYHSQFKYVRPGTTTIPGANTSAPGGAASQVRPMVNIGLVSGRGRGDWRPVAMKNAPPMHKGFHSGAGPPSWNAGRVSGGVEFTLPSHKTIFEIDIDCFKEKPWKYPGVELSDFFNFGLNEESWKEYCKQLEQLRLESTMQSKIRVYERGRTEQEFDPDMPPELAAAVGIHDNTLENPHPIKPDDVQNDVARSSTCVRPPLPTGRSIQVETGSGERLPSIDTRPPRIRDSDAIIEIVLQDSADDDSFTAAGMQEHVDNEIPREDLGNEDDINQDQSDYYNDGYAHAYNDFKGGKTESKIPDIHSAPNEMPEGGFIKEEKTQDRARSITPDYSDGKHGSAYEERVHNQSRYSTSSQELKVDDNLNEESVESLEGKRDVCASPSTDRAALDPVKADGSSPFNKEEMPSNVEENSASLKDEVKSQKLTPQVEQPLVELDDGEDSKAARNSDNSRARSGSSRDYQNQKHREGFDEEVIQDLESDRVSSIRRHLNESEHVSRQRGQDGNLQVETNQTPKTRDDFYPYREWDPSRGHQLHIIPDDFERQKDRENPYCRKNRTDDDRKRGRGEEMGSRRRAKHRENERSSKDDSLLLRKQLDNGGYLVHQHKDVGSRLRERDVLKSRYDNVEDFHNRKRKDEEYYRREYVEKEEIYREHVSRRMKERDEIVDQRKRDDRYTSRHKEDVLKHRERVDRLSDKLKSHEENPPRKERVEGRGFLRGERGLEEKTWAGHVRAKSELRVSEKEHQFKDIVQWSDQSKKRDRVDDENLHHRGRDDAHNRVNADKKQTRQGKPGICNDCPAIASDNQRFDKKSKESTRKNKELDTTCSSMCPSWRKQKDQRGQSSEMGLKGSSDQGHNEHEIAVPALVKRHREDVSSDEELHSRRGRSKLERWTSNKEKDFSIGSKPSSSMKFTEIERNNTCVSSESSKPAKESVKSTGISENHHSERKDTDGVGAKDSETKPLVDQHLDTVEKLKKRSERFKLPLPSEKEALAFKKLESEPLPSSTKNENPVESEIKQERPPRKRRWVSS